MNHWLRRIRGALGMGVTWAIGWGVAGIGIGVLSIVTPFLPWEGFFAAFDAPLPAMAVPGFFYGAVLSIVLAIAGRKRRFSELSMPRFVAWGALSGVLFPMLLLGTGVASPSGGAGFDWVRLAFLAGTLAAFSTLSAWGTLALARRAERGDPSVDTSDPAALDSGGRDIAPVARGRVHIRSD